MAKDEIGKLIRATLRDLCGGPAYHRIVEFRGYRLYLMGSLKSGGPLCFSPPENWEMSFAYLRPDGRIARYKQVIGHRNELKLLARKW